MGRVTNEGLRGQITERGGGGDDFLVCIAQQHVVCDSGCIDGWWMDELKPGRVMHFFLSSFFSILSMFYTRKV